MKQYESRFLEKNIPFRRVPLIDGIFRKVDTNSLVGYCHCSKHKGYVTVNLLKNHDCINKNCFYLEKFEDYPFWIHLMNAQKTKEQRKLVKKHNMEFQAAHKQCVERKMTKLLESAQGVADKLGYPILVVRVAPKSDTKENYEYIVNYVSDNLYNDWHLYFDLAITLGKCFGGKYILKHVKKIDGTYASIYDWENR